MPMPAATTVMIRTCRIAPGMAIRRTGASRLIENSTPRANRRRTTPSSASSLICPASPTNPGVNGPMTTPARR
jgi:hypothetical protein